jgi:hypothetical protein
MVKAITFSNGKDDTVIGIANELAQLEKRSPTDSVRLLVLEAGPKKIEELKCASSNSKDNLTQLNRPSQAKKRQGGRKIYPAE